MKEKRNMICRNDKKNGRIMWKLNKRKEKEEI
jgi:hypothetical protein